MGRVAVTRPEARPTINLPITSISTELAARQKKNSTAPTVNRAPQMRKHAFLEKIGRLVIYYLEAGMSYL